jgi:serine/threonine protein phosphatase 1
MKLFANLFTSRTNAQADDDAPAIPPGRRVYAIGDVHGELALLRRMLTLIAEDDASRSEAQTTIILLGDLVDRGPDSAGVVELARTWSDAGRMQVLGGNHEDMFLLSFRKATALRSFLRYGGRETLLSYGLTKKALRELNIDDLQEWMQAHIPPEHRTFLDSLQSAIVIGDYAFVHAGIAPDVAIEEQRMHDLRWIREPFLSHPKSHSHVIVHGHTITDDVEDMGNRIGIDTGAYASGRLTALALEGTERRIIEAIDPERAEKARD